MVIAVLFVGAAGGVAWLPSFGPFSTYLATVRIEIAADPLVAGDVPEAYVRAVTSDDVLRAALVRRGEVQPEAGQVASLRARVRTEIRGAWPGSATLHVGVTGSTPEDAEAHAEALAAALMEWDRTERLEETIDVLETRIASLTTELRTEQVLVAGSDEGEVEALAAQRTRAIERRDRAQAALEDDEPPQTLEIVGTGTTQIGTRLAQYAVLAAAIAALASLVVIVRRHRRDDRQRTPLPRATIRPAPRGAGILASFPRGRSEHDPALRVAAGHLRTAVLGRIHQAHPRVILLTSVEERSGVTVVACRLAEEFARKGRRTLLVDGDLWSPDIAERYRVNERPVNAKRASTTVEWLQQPGAQHRVATVQLDGDMLLYLIPQFRPMRPAPGAGEALFAGLATAVKRWTKFDVVVLNSAPLTVVEDTRLLAAHATGVALVVPPGGSDEQRLDSARKTLQDAGTSFLGLVENDVPPEPGSEPGAVAEPGRGPEPASGPEDERDAFARAFGPRDRRPGRGPERRSQDGVDGDR